MQIETQTEELATRLHEAVLQAAMPADEVGSSVSGENNGEKTRVGDGSAGPGRPRNVKNRLTNLREAVLEAFEMVGGAQYLAKLAAGTSSDRAAFVGLVAKVLPTQINASVDGGIQVQLSWLSGRSIGTTLSQTDEQITQVIDMERDNGGKYRIIDPTIAADASAGALADEPAQEAAGGSKDA